MNKNILASVLAALLIFSISATSLFAKGRLSDEIAEMWNTEQQISKKYDQKINSFFIKSAENRPVKFTMLIAFSERLARSVQKIVNNNVTPLICSVASLPLESTEFQPEQLQFQQGRYVWSPKMDATSWDAFPLGKNMAFGGIIEDSQVHQGVILLPAWFDVNKPINVIYQGSSKRMLLTYK